MFRPRRSLHRMLLAIAVAVTAVSAVISRLASVVGIARAAALRDAQPAPFTSTDQYETRQIEGWTVMVNPELLRDQPLLAEQALRLLNFQLYQITRKVPAAPLEKLRKVWLWVEEAEPHNPCMTYHPSAEWLRQHDMNPRKAGCVEVSNVRNFLSWTLQQPWMVLHELSHAYHHQFLKGGFENAEVNEAYRRAMTSKRYDSVLQINGNQERAYATTNAKEYFAEESESFFGTNDFYPFVKSELKKYDPETFEMLRKLWGS